VELPFLGDAGAGREAFGLGDADGGGADADGEGVGEAMGRVLLIGSTTAPWLGSATAARVPSALIAIGPSSGPSFRGNECSTPASALSQYHAPVAKVRTAISGE